MSITTYAMNSSEFLRLQSGNLSSIPTLLTLGSVEEIPNVHRTPSHATSGMHSSVVIIFCTVAVAVMMCNGSSKCMVADVQKFQNSYLHVLRSFSKLIFTCSAEFFKTYIYMFCGIFPNSYLHVLRSSDCVCVTNS
jgi:hypothetical protein